MSVADVLADSRQWHIETTDVLDGLRAMPDASVHCVVTSVPYWGLRDYGTATWEGGDPECDHAVRPAGSGIATSTLGGARATVGHQREGYRGDCGRCGAVRVDRQIGLEGTVAEWVEKLVAVFTEVRRVLRADGSLWLNCGDAYNSGTTAGRKPSGAEHGYWQAAGSMGDRRVSVPDLKVKDLVGMPWRIAFALQAEGWYLRSDIIWAKPNPMPESVTDRPTRAHEYLFLLTKSAKYFYNADAIKEPVTGGAHARRAQKMPDGWDTGPGAHGSYHRNGREKGLPGVTPQSAEPGLGIKANASFHAATVDLVDARNRRSVWSIPTEAYPDAHFATFPTALVEPCILAGCPNGGVVLDPFSGAGTTVMVALRHGRRGIGLELNPAYAEMSRRRITADAPMWNEQRDADAASESRLREWSGPAMTLV